ncbi:hypothetical protein CFC21_022892 [Triticum aestivum]|uniref:Uncharacterized protein n=3 Tax=Triticum TaxID=4564 RepID=A0A9R1RKP0_TRITD|nr:hypothetical protein CFC21_022892 [Triticum aestivum]VAH44837.1 unnamed protein product [Triticum turgidum subsp. durum]
MTYVRNILDEEWKRMKDSLQDLNREQVNNKELQENRQDLMQGFENMPISGGTIVGIKRTGLSCKVGLVLAGRNTEATMASIYDYSGQ